MPLGMNPAIAAIIRGLLVAIGGALTTAGYLSAEESTAIADRLFELLGVLFIFAPIAYAAWVNWREGKYKEALQELLGVKADKKIGPVTVGAAADLKTKAEAVVAAFPELDKKQP